MTRPDFIVVGHVVRDKLHRGWRLGGTATYAAVQAQRLGLRVGIVTRVGPDVAVGEALEGVALAGRPSTRTTVFENVYEEGRRRQRVPARAEPLGPDDIPSNWRSIPVVLLGPVCGEVPAGLGALFSESLVGVSAQGWLRQVDVRGRVRRRAWTGPAFWSECRALFVSEEDLGRRRDQMATWVEEVETVVLTRDRRGVEVHTGGRIGRIGAFPARSVDPTGAGDVFAAAFLVRYHESGKADESARFASAAAAFSVEAVGIEGIAGRSEIEARMKEHPEIALL